MEYTEETKVNTAADPSVKICPECGGEAVRKANRPEKVYTCKQCKSNHFILKTK